MVSQERTPIQVIRASGRVLSAKPAVRWQNVYLADVKLRQQTMSTKVYPFGHYPRTPAVCPFRCYDQRRTILHVAGSETRCCPTGSRHGGNCCIEQIKYSLVKNSSFPERMHYQHCSASLSNL